MQPKTEHLTEAAKMVSKLEKMRFNDTGCLNNAYRFERNYILALAMYYKMVRYDPSDRFTQTYKNKDILTKYKMISEEKIGMNQTLYKICSYMHNINTRIKNKQNKNKFNKTK